MEIDHVGYLVKKLEKAKEEFLALGYVEEGECVYDPIRDIDILFLKNGAYRIELVAPRSQQSVVWDTAKKLGNTPYHICYLCDDIEETAERMREKRFTPASDILPAIACGNRRVCFLYHRAIGIIELLERV